MNDNQLEDLKQFIAASVSQSEKRLRIEMNQGFRAVRQEMTDGFRGVGEAIDVIHKQLEEQHEINTTVDRRLTKLEPRVA